MTEHQIEKVVNDFLEEYTLEEFFEFFNLTPYEVVQAVYEAGLLDELILERMLPTDA